MLSMIFSEPSFVPLAEDPTPATSSRSTDKPISLRRGLLVAVSLPFIFILAMAIASGERR
jgi:hypothetical protein